MVALLNMCYLLERYKRVVEINSLLDTQIFIHLALVANHM
jgi:hypothetical protein